MLLMTSHVFAHAPAVVSRVLRRGVSQSSASPNCDRRLIGQWLDISFHHGCTGLKLRVNGTLRKESHELTNHVRISANQGTGNVASCH